jgi:hypothetical protein
MEKKKERKIGRKKERKYMNRNMSRGGSMSQRHGASSGSGQPLDMEGNCECIE